MSKEILFAPNLSALSSVRHAFFTRGWGNGGFSGQGALGELAVVRAGMEEYLRVEPRHLLCCEQIHSNEVVTVSEIWRGQNAPRADAMVTNKTGIALGILTADCAPILLADSEAGVIGAAHAGWRGAVGGVIENTIAAMEKLGARRGDIRAALGPCIGRDSYEVGGEFLAAFLAEGEGNGRFFRDSCCSSFFDTESGGSSPSPPALTGGEGGDRNSPKSKTWNGVRWGGENANDPPNPPHPFRSTSQVPRSVPPLSPREGRAERGCRRRLPINHYHFDLSGYIVEKLRGLGIGSVESSPADTCAEPERFFSHRYSTLRGEKREGNLVSTILLTAQ
ncbi:MAG: polyphenol oxidase family protein [Alphaproteobacteria bacterium]|nr:polyphenol oxidase family protein [Alphaproteobacteria bacterium]